VSLVGELRDDALESCFDRADVVVLASRQETYGMAVAEALARGIPVVSTGTGAIAELVNHEAGLVVPVDDRAALASALARVIRDDESPHAPCRRGSPRAQRPSNLGGRCGTNECCARPLHMDDSLAHWLRLREASDVSAGLRR
jgi:glycosyltransferase involved in cell wall biosynthesis